MDGKKSGFVEILVALHIEFDSFNFLRTIDHTLIVPLIQTLLTFNLFSVTSLKNGSDSIGTFLQVLCSIPTYNASASFVIHMIIALS